MSEYFDPNKNVSYKYGNRTKLRNYSIHPHILSETISDVSERDSEEYTFEAFIDQVLAPDLLYTLSYHSDFEEDEEGSPTVVEFDEPLVDLVDQYLTEMEIRLNYYFLVNGIMTTQDILDYRGGGHPGISKVEFVRDAFCTSNPLLREGLYDLCEEMEEALEGDEPPSRRDILNKISAQYRVNLNKILNH